MIPMFPVRWIPKFLRSSFVIEEVVKEEAKFGGYYNPIVIQNCVARAIDERHDLAVSIEFRDGYIWVREEKLHG